ncbi:MAG: hypothetical protein ACIAQF_09855 [Phycisphaerales bacterium JB065]
MKRWIIRIFVGLVILLIAVVITAHVILRSDLPRQIVLDTLREKTGLRVEASSLEVSWTGRSVLHDLEIGLPLEADPFVTVRRVRVRHNALVILALTRSLGLSDVRLVDPVITLETTDAEQWNIIEAAEIISLSLDRETNPKPTSAPELPRLRIERASVEVNLPDGRELQYTPFTITGAPDGAQAWSFALSLQNHIALTGRLAPSSGWDHRLAFDLDRVRPLIEPFVQGLPEPLDASGTWRGNIRSGSLAGSLTVDTLDAGEIAASGSIGAELIGTELAATPSNLVIHRNQIERLRISGGTINANLNAITATNIVGHADGYADFECDGTWSFPDSTGSAELVWRGNATQLLDDPVQHEGTLEAQLSISPLGTLSAAATVNTTGRATQGTWDLAFDLTAEGDPDQQITASTRFTRATFHSAQANANLAGLDANAIIKGSVITEARVTIPDTDPQRQPLSLVARADTTSLDWRATIEANDYHPPLTFSAFPDLPPLTIAARANGNPDQAVLESLSATAEGIAVTAHGHLTLADLAANFALSAQRNDLALGESLIAPSSTAHATVTGTLQPLAIEFAGSASVIEPTYRNRSLNTIASEFTGSASRESLALTINPFELLGGTIRARGAYSTGDSEAKVFFSGHDIALERVAQVLGIPVALTGTATADLAASIPLADPARTIASGTWSATGVNAADLALIDGAGTLIAGSSELRLPEITLRNAEGTLRGEARMDLDHPDRFHAVFKLEDWPLALADHAVEVTTDANADLDVYLSPLGATGTANLAMDLRYHDKPGATMEIQSSIEGRDLHIESLTGSSLGGSVVGNGLIPLSPDFWNRASLHIEWDRFDFAEAITLWPQLDKFSGTSIGTLDIRPTQDPRAALPLELRIEAHFTEARFANFTLGDDKTAEPDLTSRMYFGRGRAEIEQAKLIAADGSIDLYARASDHDGEIAMFGHVFITDLDLQQIASAANLEDRPMPGRVSGEWTVGGSLNPPHRLFGRATLELTESDLVALPGITQVYNALSLDLGKTEPNGEGQATIRLEGSTLEISRLDYFNRGTNILASLRIQNIFSLQRSPIEGIAVGSARPIAVNSQSFFSSIDRMIRAAQSNAAAVEIGGTLDKPETSLVPLKDLTDAVRRLFRGSTQ